MPAWGDNGVQIARQLPDQQVVASGWGTSQLKVPFKALRTAGYVRRLVAFSPATTMNVTHSTGTNALPSKAQLSGFRVFNRIQVQMQGIAYLYDVQGLDIPYLFVMNSGDALAGDNLLWNVDNQAGTTNVNGGNSTANYLNSAVYTSNTSLVTINYTMLPITEKIIFRDSIVQQKSGSVVIADKPLEIGILTLQNTQSNVLPVFTLNPSNGAGANNVDVQLQLNNSGAGDTLAAGNPTWNLSSDLFDVPDDPSQRPLPFTQAFVITRSTFDTTAAGASATTTVNFRPAGFLVRCHYLFMDTNNNTYDEVANQPGATLDFKWGATVSKFTETMQENAGRMVTRSVGVPPQGAAYHDFMQYDGTATDYVNTAVLPNVRCEIKTNTATVTTVRTCETRMIPVKLS